jgi:Asp-tRNA(Asn)/Glu-tRNA(Gln) amidotransferase A subunit family amidase
MVAAEMAEIHKNWFALYEPLYRTHTKQIINEGLQIGKCNQDELYNARDGRFILRTKIESFKKNYNINLWVSPSTLTTAPKGLESTGSPLMNLPWTYSGLPTITFPAGKNSQNLPIGLQFSGSFNEDEMMLSMVQKKMIGIFDRLP